MKYNNQHFLALISLSLTLATPQVYPKDWALISSGLAQWSDSLTGGQKAFIGATLAVSTIGAGYMFYLRSMRSKRRKLAGEKPVQVEVVNGTQISKYSIPAEWLFDHSNPPVASNARRDQSIELKSIDLQEQAHILAEIPNEHQHPPALSNPPQSSSSSSAELSDPPVVRGGNSDQQADAQDSEGEQSPQYSIEEMRTKRLERLVKKCCVCNSSKQTSLQRLDCNHFICTGSKSCHDTLTQENEIQCPTCNKKSHLS